MASLTAAQNPQGQQQQQPGMSGQGMMPNEGGGPQMMGQRHGINIGFKGRMPHIRPPKPVGTIDVIGAPSQNPMRPSAPRENVIQVMTADRREYSRTVVNQPMQFNVPPEEFYNHEEQDAFNYGYEPTQDSQWNQNQGGPGWAPSEIKELTPIFQPNIPPPHGPPPHMPRMPMMNQQQIIPPLMVQHMPSMNMNIKQEGDDKRGEIRRMGNYGGSNRDMRDDRKRRERSSSRERSARSSRDDRYRGSDRSSTRESGSRLERRRSKSRERKRSRSREKSRRSKSREKDRSRRDDKSSSSKSRSGKKEEA